MIERIAYTDPDELLSAVVESDLRVEDFDRSKGRAAIRFIIGHALLQGEEFTRRNDPEAYDYYAGLIATHRNFPVPPGSSLGRVLQFQPRPAEEPYAAHGVVHAFGEIGLLPTMIPSGQYLARFRRRPQSTPDTYVIGDVAIGGREIDPATELPRNDYNLKYWPLLTGDVRLEGTTYMEDADSEMFGFYEELRLNRITRHEPGTSLTFVNEPVGIEQIEALAQYVTRRVSP